VSQKLELIYENIDVLVAKKNFIVLPNEVFRFTKKMADARIISYDRLMVAWDTLTYKHDEKNPFPSHETLAKAFGIGKRAITGAISEIVDAGLFINEKGKYGTDKRKNTYNVSPLLNLLACFVERVREGVDVCIKELYNDVVRGGMKARKVSATEEQPKKEEVTMSEAIIEALNGVEESRRKALEGIVKKNVERLDEETIVHTIAKIEANYDSTKGSYVGLATIYFKNANNGDKRRDEAKKQEQPKKQYEGKKKASRSEMLPSWMSGVKSEEELRYDEVTSKTHAQLLNMYDEEMNIKIEDGSTNRIEAEKEHLIPAFYEWAKKKLEESEFDTYEAYGNHLFNVKKAELEALLKGFGKAN
jgi:hypothetical protein